MIVEGVHGYWLNVPPGARVTVTVELPPRDVDGGTAFLGDSRPDDGRLMIAESERVDPWQGTTVSVNGHWTKIGPNEPIRIEIPPASMGDESELESGPPADR